MGVAEGGGGGGTRRVGFNAWLAAAAAEGSALGGSTSTLTFRLEARLPAPAAWVSGGFWPAGMGDGSPVLGFTSSMAVTEEDAGGITAVGFKAQVAPCLATAWALWVS